jgi:hypothetical protein
MYGSWPGVFRGFAGPAARGGDRARRVAGFMHAFDGLLDGTHAAEIVLQNGWADETRLAEIVAAFDRFGADTSNCFAFPWAEAVAFKPV